MTELTDQTVRFLALFPSRVDSLIKYADAGSWRVTSRFHHLGDDQILDSISDNSNNIRACSFDSETSFAVISIPPGSPYAEPVQYHRLIEVLASCDLRPKAYKAAGCDEVHVYLFFSETYDTAVIATALTDLLQLNIFEIGTQHLTVHPSGSALTLPLQRNFEWLNDDLLPIVKRSEIPLNSALTLFCADVTRNATSAAGLFKTVELLKSELDNEAFSGLSTQLINPAIEHPIASSVPAIDTKPADDYTNEILSNQVVLTRDSSLPLDDQPPRFAVKNVSDPLIANQVVLIQAQPLAKRSMVVHSQNVMTDRVDSVYPDVRGSPLASESAQHNELIETDVIDEPSAVQLPLFPMLVRSAFEHSSKKRQERQRHTAGRSPPALIHNFVSM